MRWRLLSLLAGSALIISGCDQKAFLNKFVPEAEDRLARSFLEKIINGQVDEALPMLAPSLQGADGRKGLEQLAHFFHEGTVEPIETIGVFTRFSSVSGKHLRSVELSYQLHLAHGWSAGVIVINEQDGIRQITTARFNPYPDSAENINRFTLSGKGPGHYFFLLLAILIPACCVTSVVLCARSAIRRKWLWIIFILLGFFSVRLNWTTGQMDYQAISFLLLGASIFKNGLYGAWILSLAFPVGAIIFLIKRKDLIAQKAAVQIPVSPPTSPTRS